MNTREKGNKNRRLAKQALEEQGYWVEIVEKTGRWVVGSRDLFGLFDLIAISPFNTPLLVQVTTNRSHLHYPLEDFTKKYGAGFNIQQWVKVDRKGWKITEYNKTGHFLISEDPAVR